LDLVQLVSREPSIAELAGKPQFDVLALGHHHKLGQARVRRRLRMHRRQDEQAENGRGGKCTQMFRSQAKAVQSKVHFT
jgi:hypothetical protein